MINIIHSLIEHVQAHPYWLWCSFFLAGLVSGLPLIGALVPASLYLFSAGAVAACAEFDLVYVGLITFAAVMTGDIIGFVTGRYFHHNIRELKYFRKRAHLIFRAETFFHRYGGISLIAGRMAGPLRSLMPFGAGVLSMRYVSFFLFDALAAMIFCITHIGPGYITANPFLWQWIKQTWHQMLY